MATTWNIFGPITNLVDTPLTSAVNGIASNLMPAAIQAFTYAGVIWIAFIAIKVMTGRLHEPLRDIFWQMAIAALVGSLMTAATYNSWVINVFLTDLPTKINGLIAGGGPISANSFDALWGKAFAGGVGVWKTLSWTDFGLQFLIVVYWVVAAISVALGFMIWIASHVLLAIFLALGPIPFVMYLFPPTRGMFERWVGAVCSCIFLQAMIAVLLSILITAETNILSSMSIGGAAGNPIAEVQLLIGAVILFIVAALIITQLPGAATALSGGLHFQVGALSRATYGRAMSLSQSAVVGSNARANNLISQGVSKLRSSTSSAGSASGSTGRSLSAAPRRPTP